MKLACAKWSLRIRDQLGVVTSLWKVIGALEVLGSAGLLAGLVVPALGAAAAIMLGLLMAGAIAAHGRVQDLRHAGPAALLLVITIAVAILQMIST